MKIRLSPAGSRVTTVWLALIGLAVGGALCWLHRPTGLVFWGLWAGFCLYYLCFYAPSVVIRWDERELVIASGLFFPTQKRIPLHSLCGITRYSSPLLRAVDCAALLLYASSGLLCFLSGLAAGDAQRVADLLREDRS